jgi:hypothetical protein
VCGTFLLLGLIVFLNKCYAEIDGYEWLRCSEAYSLVDEMLIEELELASRFYSIFRCLGLRSQRRCVVDSWIEKTWVDTANDCVYRSVSRKRGRAT